MKKSSRLVIILITSLILSGCGNKNNTSDTIEQVETDEVVGQNEVESIESTESEETEESEETVEVQGNEDLDLSSSIYSGSSEKDDEDVELQNPVQPEEGDETELISTEINTSFFQDDNFVDYNEMDMESIQRNIDYTKINSYVLNYYMNTRDNLDNEIDLSYLQMYNDRINNYELDVNFKESWNTYFTGITTEGVTIEEVQSLTNEIVYLLDIKIKEMEGLNNMQ